jgi:hypothetical protein
MKGKIEIVARRPEKIPLKEGKSNTKEWKARNCC